MRKRTLEELNLLDDFLFGKVVTYPELGERFVRRLLQVVFRRPFGKLHIVSQQVYYGDDTDLHGARLDVYLEEQPEEGAPLQDTVESQSLSRATVYDIEPEQKDGKRIVSALPRRIRFYRAKIDSKSLESGDDYDCLRDVVILMIMPFDPFGRDRMVYTIRSGCVEDPEMPYEDGATTVFLYTKGKHGNPPEDLRQLLRFMEKTTRENAVNDTLKEMQDIVERVKRDKEVSLQYMKIFEREKMLVQEGEERGLERGMELGREQGLELGREQGIELGREQGIELGREQGIEQGLERGREDGIREFILDNLEEGISQDRIQIKLVRRFHLTEMQAQDYLAKYASQEELTQPTK